MEKVKSEVFTPEVLNEMAKTSGAIERIRKLDGAALLDTVLFDPDASYNSISMQLMRRHDVDVSRQALHQKYNGKMGTFVKTAFERLLTLGLPEEEIQGMEIKIKDSTKFGLPDSMAELFPGTKGKGIKAGVSVQFEFGIKSGTSTIKLTAANENDQGESHLDKESACPGTIYMRDLAYAHMDYMNNIRDKEAFFINKLNAKAVIYTWNGKEYKALDLEAVQNIAGVFDQQVYIGEEKMPARVIIEPVSPELKAARIANTEKENKKKGHATSEYFKLRAGFNFIITNLSVEKHKAELIQKLYHLRWQIELVFKAWKSLLKMHQIKKTNEQRIYCMLYGKLLWAVLSWKIYTAVGKIGQISILKVHSLIAETKELLREQLWGINTKWLQLLASIPLNRVLKEQKKYRIKTEKLIISI
jgi:Transposase DDE domain